MARVDAIRHVSITEQTYYRPPLGDAWHRLPVKGRKQYGGMGTGQLKQLKKSSRRKMSNCARLWLI